MAESFSIGDLARRTGTKIETIRYYEQHRSAAGRCPHRRQLSRAMPAAILSG